MHLAVHARHANIDLAQLAAVESLLGLEGEGGHRLERRLVEVRRGMLGEAEELVDAHAFSGLRRRLRRVEHRGVRDGRNFVGVLDRRDDQALGQLTRSKIDQVADAREALLERHLRREHHDERVDIFDRDEELDPTVLLARHDVLLWHRGYSRQQASIVSFHHLKVFARERREHPIHFERANFTDVADQIGHIDEAIARHANLGNVIASGHFARNRFETDYLFERD